MRENSLKAEEKRLAESDSKEKDWKFWGCYVSERAWGTVREDYSADGAAWDFFPFEHAASRTFRWNEDGIAGICDRKQNLCFALSLWNEKDEILKERFFGLNGNAGNHGEDVKDYYFYLDNTPTHSYMKFLYKYPHAEFPYQKIYEENAKRDKSQPEYELTDTGVFDENKYTDVFIEYAKVDFDDILIKITAANRSAETAVIHLLPTVWFRNVWAWGAPKTEVQNPKSKVQSPNGGLPGCKMFASDARTIEINNSEIGKYTLFCDNANELLFCDNETNYRKLFGAENKSPFTKDGINDYIVNGNGNAVNPEKMGTKAAAHYILELPANESKTIYLRLFQDDFHRQAADAQNESSNKNEHVEKEKESKIQNPKSKIKVGDSFTEDYEEFFRQRIHEADKFYASITPNVLSDDEKSVMRQALAGMLWSKQYYNYVVKDWLEGDSNFAAPPKERLSGRNKEWTHLYNSDIISMPDKWEYPWYAAWDLAFHTIPLALVDSAFAKRQLILLLREWYMHPNGQIPAYEWKFSDVNPPVHAWAAMRVYKIEAKRTGVADRAFLERVFHKLLLNFTWWINRKDYEGNNVFEGGFLGLDNIGVFDRSADLPSGGQLEQSDGTSWMAMYCLNMLGIALELAKEDSVYEDVASKFFEHFVYISDAMNNVGHENTELWNERDGFYYDVLHLDGEQFPIRLRSMVGLIPLFAVETVQADWLEKLPDFKRRTEWFLENRPDLTGEINCLQEQGRENRRILSIVTKNQLQSILRYMLAEDEFLSDYGIRSLSRFHKNSPYLLTIGNSEYRVKYEPAESQSGMFGGNSNWRGPVWFPMNYLLIEALQKFDFFYGEDFKVEFPTGSGNTMTLWEISQELEKRLCRIFVKDDEGRRAVFGENKKFQTDEHWRDRVLFYEYFHGDSGAGLGASHQTGWTGLMGKILQQLGEYAAEESGKHVETADDKTEEGQSEAIEI